jgi:MATE family multidrug resistance protein
MGAIGYWAVGMPVGLLLAFTYDLKGRWYVAWLGIRLAFVALALLWRWVIVTWRMDVGTNFLK